MANVDRPGGASPVQHLTTGGYNGQVRKYSVGSTAALFVGDAVKSSGSADTHGVPGVERGTASGPIRGFVVGVEVNPDVAETIHPGFLPANTPGYVYVVEDPFVVFEIQEDSVGGALGASDVGKKVGYTSPTGDTTTGTSKLEIDSSTAGTGTALILMGIAQKPDNEYGISAKWLVKIANHELG